MPSKIKTNMTHKTKVELYYTTIYGSSELMLLSDHYGSGEVNHALHDDEYQKAITFGKKPFQPIKSKQQPLQGSRTKISFKKWLHTL